MINVELVIEDRSLQMDIDPSITWTDYRLTRLIKTTKALVGHLKLIKLDLRKTEGDYVFQLESNDGRKWEHILCTLCEDPFVTPNITHDWCVSEIVMIMEYQTLLMQMRNAIALETLEYGIIGEE